MIVYFGITQADFNNIAMLTKGDGSATVLKINTSKPPFNINFQGMLPDSFQVDVGDEVITASASIADSVDGPIVTVTFSAPPDVNGITSINLTCKYNSLP